MDYLKHINIMQKNIVNPIKDKQTTIQNLVDWYNDPKENGWRRRTMKREDVMEMYEFVACNPKKRYKKNIYCLREGHDTHQVCAICGRMNRQYFNGKCKECYEK